MEVESGKRSRYTPAFDPSSFPRSIGTKTRGCSPPCSRTKLCIRTGSNSDTEEAVNDYMLSIVYGQESLEDPSLPRTFTELTQRLNIFLLALINDRDALGNLRVEICNCTNIFPGQPAPYAADIRGVGRCTAVRLTLRAMLSSTAC